MVGATCSAALLTLCRSALGCVTHRAEDDFRSLVPVVDKKQGCGNRAVQLIGSSDSLTKFIGKSFS